MPAYKARFVMKFEQPHGQVLLGSAAAIVSGICAGLIWPINKELTRVLDPAQITWLEAVVATVILLPLYLHRFRGRLMPQRTPWPWLLTFGLTAVMLFYMRTLGVKLTNATTGALITRSEVILVFAYSYFFLHDRLSPVGWLGSVAMMAGMVAALDVSSSGLAFHLRGVAALMASTVGVASNAIIIKVRLGSVRNELTALVNATCQAVVLLLILTVAGEVSGLWPALHQTRTLVLVLLAGVFVPVMLVCYYYAMKRVPLWSARLLALVTPAVAMLGDHFWLHSHISHGQLLGLVLVTGGAAMVITAGARRVPATVVEAL